MSDPVASVAPFSIINGNIALHVMAEAYPKVYQIIGDY